jgi:spore coat-associated protein N
MTAAATAPVRRSRRLLVPLATLLAATGIAVASGATFSTSTASTGLATSGTLRQINSNAVAFEQTDLKPGDTVTGAVTITNSGTLPAAFTLTEAQVSNTFEPAGDLTLAITDETGKVVSNTTLGAAAPVSLGLFAAGDAHTYTYKVTVSAGATNAQQNKLAKTTYTFSSIQTDATDYVTPQSGVVQDVPLP